MDAILRTRFADRQAMQRHTRDAALGDVTLMGKTRKPTSSLAGLLLEGWAFCSFP
jgi:hypothetical protein